MLVRLSAPLPLRTYGHRSYVSIGVPLLLLLLVLLVARPAAAQYTLTIFIPFFAPFGVCVDNAGTLYVSDTANRRVVHVSSTGQLMGTFTTTNPQLDVASGLALNNANTLLYVSDSSNNRLIALSLQTGAVVLTFQGATFDGPYQPVVDQYDNVYVSDNSRVYKFNSSGALQWVNNGSSSSVAFDVLEGLAINAAGDLLYVADTLSNLLFTLNTSTGAVQSVLQTSNPTLRSPSALAYNPSSNVLYAADTTNNRLVQFNNPNSSQSYTVWSPTFNNPRGVAVDSYGSVYVTDTENDRVTKYTPAAVEVARFYGDNGLGLGQNGCEGLAVDAAGNVFISDTFNNRVQKMTAAGIVSQVSPIGLLNTPIGVAIDAAGALYVADSKNGRIVKFSSSGAVLMEFNSTAHPSPYGVAIDAATGNMYITDTQMLAVIVVSATGSLLSVIQSNPSFVAPCSIALDSQLNMYVADTGLNAVLKIAPNGTVVTLAAGLLVQAKGVAVDSNTGDVWIADGGAHAVKRLSGAGVLLSTTASSNYPYAVTLDPSNSGTLYTVGFDGLIIFRPCAAGYYCPPGSTTALPCPANTYNNLTMQQSNSSCLPCTVAAVSSGLCASTSTSSSTASTLSTDSSSGLGGSQHGGSSPSSTVIVVIAVVVSAFACSFLAAAAWMVRRWWSKSSTAEPPTSPGVQQQQQLERGESSTDFSVHVRKDYMSPSGSGLHFLSAVDSTTSGSGGSYVAGLHSEQNHSPLSPISLLGSEAAGSLPLGLIPWSDLEIFDRPPLGSGGCGKVVLGRWTSRHDIVAIKVLHSQDKGGEAEHRQFMKEFQREVGLMFHLQAEERVVRMRGACLEPGHECIVMEYLEHGSLFDFLKTDKGKSMSWPARNKLAFEMVQAINVLHLYPLGPIYHADIKSLNFLLDRNYSIKVSDFGLSRVKQALTTVSTAMPGAGAQAGTLQWTAPELMVKQKDRPAYTAACDIFSLGVVLWELATNEVPWSGENLALIPLWVLHERQRLPIPREKVPDYFCEWIEACWQHDPAKRPTCAELLDRISEQLPRPESTTATSAAAATDSSQHLSSVHRGSAANSRQSMESDYGSEHVQSGVRDRAARLATV